MEVTNPVFYTDTSSNASFDPKNPSPCILGPTLSYHNISYTARTKDLTRLCGQKSVEVLKEMSGVFRPGLNAILGPTGGGKSSLLDVLAGLKDPSEVEGVVLMDGQELPADFYKNIGYVTQEDMLMGTLTVRENISFSADLRLAQSQEEKQASVDSIISQLQLDRCADSKVGDEWTRGVSGGERRRTNIAMEMLKQPRILFLDEPTSGLDAHTALSVVSLLHRLSLEGRTIILSIHQPRYSIFKLFHSLTILLHGQTVFHGPSHQALPYFTSIGYLCEEHDNPSDFLLDVITRKTNSDGKGFNALFSNSQANELLTFELKSLEGMDKSCKQAHCPSSTSGTYAVGFLAQMKYLSKRSLLNLTRNYHFNALQVLITATFSVIIGMLFLQINTKHLSVQISLQNRTGALFYLLVNQMFMAVSEVDTFIKDRVIFRHEHAKGYYRISTYFLTKIIFDSLLMRIFSIFIFSIISYLLIGFESSASEYFLFLYSLLMVSLTCSCFCFLVGSCSSSPPLAQTAVMFFFVAMALLSGFLVNLGQMHVWMSWLSHFSILKYAINVNYISHLKNLKLTVNNGTHTYIDTHSATERLDMLAVKHADAFDVWSNLLVLQSYACLLLAATYLRLRFTPKHK